MPNPPKSADQGDSDDPAQTSKEVLAKIAEGDKDETEEPKLPKRGGLPPENDPPSA
jgi:hypothetical protein